MTNTNQSSAQFLLGMSLWFVLACVVGASGRIATLTPPQPQLVIAGLSVGLFVWGWLHPGLRDWLSHVNLRGFVAFHITRFVGLQFLMMSASGELSREWAIPAGWGDTVVAASALLIVLLLPNPESRPNLLRLWNLVGLIDIFAVVVTAARAGMRDPASMAPLFHFPMSLVPTFIVPIVFASHCWMALRLQPRARPATTPA